MKRDDNFLQRIIQSLGYASLVDLVLATDGQITYDELEAIGKGSRGQTEEIDQSETWQKIIHHINTRLAGILAAREELQRKLNNDRRAREKRREEIRCR